MVTGIWSVVVAVVGVFAAYCLRENKRDKEGRNPATRQDVEVLVAEPLRNLSGSFGIALTKGAEDNEREHRDHGQILEIQRDHSQVLATILERLRK